MINITIGNKQYQVQEAKTPEELKKGLQGIKELPENEGMLFYFDGIVEPEMYMSGVDIPLDIVFINEDLEVTKVQEGIPNDETLISSNGTMYVLEVNANSGIKVGDELEFEEDEGPVMKILAPDGSTLMELWGGERIFRRTFTKLLIRLVKKADKAETEELRISLYKRIGKKMFKELDKLDSNTPEYVKLPD